MNTHTLTTLSNWGSKGLTIFINLYSIRILSQKLSEQDYALFILLMGLQSWLVLIDLGVGSSIQNYVVEQRANKKNYDIYLYNGYILSWGLFIIFSVIFSILRVPLASSYLSEISISISEKISYVTLVFLLLSITFLNETIYKVKYGEEEGYKGIIIYSVGRILGFIGIVLLSLSSQQHSVITYILISLSPSAMISFLYYGYRFFHIASLSLFSKSVTRQILSRGFLFWLYSIALYLPFFTEYWVLGKFLSSKDIVFYNLLKRLYEIPSFMYNAILLSSWVVFTQLYIQKDYRKIIEKIRKNILIGMTLLILATALLSVLAAFILKILAPEFIFLSDTIWIAFFGVYFILRVWVDTFSTFLQSVSKLHYLIIFYTFVGVISILLEFYLTTYFKLYGIVAALVIPLFILSIILPLYVKKVLKYK
ncbi:MAG: MATE family efflux transporter [Thermonemataceae bacterium]|nr:MATE family efflux transporter [Thermonemataceae bacterium]